MPNDHTAWSRLSSTSHYKYILRRGRRQGRGKPVTGGGKRGMLATPPPTRAAMQIDFFDGYPYRKLAPDLESLAAGSRRMDAAVAFVTRPGVALLRRYLKTRAPMHLGPNHSHRSDCGSTRRFSATYTVASDRAALTATRYRSKQRLPTPFLRPVPKGHP